MKPAELKGVAYASVIPIAFDWPAIRGLAEAKWVAAWNTAVAECLKSTSRINNTIPTITLGSAGRGPFRV